MRQSAKRILRHLALGAGSAVATYAVYRGVGSDDSIFRLSMATAYVGLGLLVATLAMGPLNVLRSRPNPVSTNLRRDIAIWAGIVSLVHLAVGLQVHFRGFWWQYFLFPLPFGRTVPLRYDAFGLANWTGLFAGLVFIVLLALSNDLSLRRLGTERWKGIQRWNYWAFVLVFIHGAVYQLVLEGRNWPWVLTFAALVAATAALQVAGFRRVRRSRSRKGPVEQRARKKDVARVIVTCGHAGLACAPGDQDKYDAEREDPYANQPLAE